MDAPSVRIAAPDNWRERLGDNRLAAVFLGDDLEPDVINRVITDVGDVDPNTPIVMVSAKQETQ